MTHRVCPWWLGYWLICPVRLYWQSPREILAPYVHEGMTVLEPGPGMGHFTLELAHLVGSSGRVVAVDVQPKMIDRLKRRSAKAGLLDRVEARTAPAESMGITDLHSSVDFTLAFAACMNSRMPLAFLPKLPLLPNPALRFSWPNPAGTSRRLHSMLNCKPQPPLASGWSIAHPSGVATLRY